MYAFDYYICIILVQQGIQTMWKKSIATLMTAVLLASCGGQNASDNQATASSGNQNNKNAIELLNVSYDVMRDFYKDYNSLFA